MTPQIAINDPTTLDHVVPRPTKIEFHILLIPSYVSVPRTMGRGYNVQQCEVIRGKFPLTSRMPAGCLPQLGSQLAVLPTGTLARGGFAYRTVYDVLVGPELVLVLTDWRSIGLAGDLEQFRKHGFYTAMKGSAEDLIRRLRNAPVKPDWAA